MRATRDAETHVLFEDGHTVRVGLLQLCLDGLHVTLFARKSLNIAADAAKLSEAEAERTLRYVK